jgi:hypothetical protein
MGASDDESDGVGCDWEGCGFEITEELPRQTTSSVSISLPISLGFLAVGASSRSPALDFDLSSVCQKLKWMILS